MFGETVEQPHLAVEGFVGKVCRGGRLFVGFKFRDWCGCGGDVVNRDTFDEETTLVDDGVGGQVEKFVRTFGHVCELGFIITVRLGIGV